MTQNGPKGHKYDPKMTRTFSAIFLTEKVVPQKFSLLEFMNLYGKYISFFKTNDTCGLNNKIKSKLWRLTKGSASLLVGGH